jgi:hypothetical protein
MLVTATLMESSGQRPEEANSTGGQGLRRAVAPSDDDDHHDYYSCYYYHYLITAVTN